MKLKDDIAIERIREVRHRISAEHGHSAKKIVNYYLELQKKYKDRLEQASEDNEVRAESVEIR